MDKEEIYGSLLLGAVGVYNILNGNINVYSISYEKDLNNFFSLGESRRKFICFAETADEARKHSSNKVFLLTKNNMPRLEFPKGSPKVGNIYIKHPESNTIYYPLETYKMDLLEEKLIELDRVAQAIGAVDVSIIIDSFNKTNTSSSSDSSYTISARSGKFGANMDYGTSSKNKVLMELSNRISLHTVYSGHSCQNLPSDLIWYNFEPNWKRMVEARKSGDAQSREVIMETRLLKQTEMSEVESVESSLSMLFGNIKGKYSYNSEFREMNEESVTFKVQVLFR